MGENFPDDMNEKITPAQALITSPPSQNGGSGGQVNRCAVMNYAMHG